MDQNLVQLEFDKFTDAETAQPIDEKTADKLLVLAGKNGRINDLLNEVMASQIEKGFDLPQNLRGQLVAFLRGGTTANSKSEDPEPQNWSRDYMINRVAGSGTCKRWSRRPWGNGSLRCPS